MELERCLSVGKAKRCKEITKYLGALVPMSITCFSFLYLKALEYVVHSLSHSSGGLIDSEGKMSGRPFKGVNRQPFSYPNPTFIPTEVEVS